MSTRFDWPGGPLPDIGMVPRIARRLRRSLIEVGRTELLFITALWISLVPNLATLRSFATSPSSGEGIVAVLFTLGGWLFTLFISFGLVSGLASMFWGRSVKVACIALLLLAATFGYFSLMLGTHFDRTMFVNMVETNPQETLELINGRLMLWIAAVGGLPAAWMGWVKLRPSTSITRSVLDPLVILIGLVGVTAAIVLTLYPRYASAARNRSITFDTVAPANVLAAAIHHGATRYRDTRVRAPRGVDARQSYALAKPRLVVFVLGETARAQNFGLNGYERDTTPRLRALGGFYFPDTESCGTATAISLPCIFSGFGREEFSLRRGLSNETLIDVMHRGGARVIWRDNDSGCKGVCDKADLLDVTGYNDPRWCTEAANCFDEILLDGLEQKLRSSTRDTFLVLHLKSSHGPAYYKRYPPAFERFRPTCQTNDLAACDPAAVRNAYDNSILYTDHVLGEIAILLTHLSDQFATAMLYASDHGESIGESGLYLHGMPYALAPKEQTRVPMYAWVSPQFLALENWDAACLARQTKVPRSHDNIYPTLLGMLEISTAEYKKELDIFGECEKRIAPRHINAGTALAAISRRPSP